MNKKVEVKATIKDIENVVADNNFLERFNNKNAVVASFSTAKENTEISIKTNISVLEFITELSLCFCSKSIRENIPNDIKQAVFKAVKKGILPIICNNGGVKSMVGKSSSFSDARLKISCEAEKSFFFEAVKNEARRLIAGGSLVGEIPI